MFKVLIFIVIFCAIALLVVTAFLVIMNWSEKVWNPVLSLFGIWIVTTFVTVFLMMKETTIEKSFMTSIIVNGQTSLPPMLGYSPTNQQNNRLAEYVGLAAPQMTLDGKETIFFELPKNFDERVTFYEELLQYKLFKEIVEMHSERQAISIGIAGLRTSINRPFVITKIMKKPLKEYASILALNRFSKKPMEQHIINNFFLKLPEGTKISFERVLSSPETGVEKHKIILQKRFFFTVEIIIESSGSIGPGGPSSLPLGLEISSEDAKNCHPYIFPITLKAKFERITAGNWQTNEYKAWVNWMFSNIEDKYSDNAKDVNIIQ